MPRFPTSDTKVLMSVITRKWKAVIVKVILILTGEHPGVAILRATEKLARG